MLDKLQQVACAEMAKATAIQDSNKVMENFKFLYQSICSKLGWVESEETYQLFRCAYSAGLETGKQLTIIGMRS